MRIGQNTSTIAYKTRQDKTNFGCKTGACKEIIEFLKENDKGFKGKDDEIAAYLNNILEGFPKTIEHEEDAKEQLEFFKNEKQNGKSFKKILSDIKDILKENYYWAKKN